MSVRLNDTYLDARDSVKTVDAFRVATGRAEMPREWMEAMSRDGAERTLWQTDEQLRPPPPVE